ncbi:tetratricopeptide repeat protein, partial [Nostoc sp.]|uniref:tetratricopeptide repeat protein n=1 Tax=Nostoc sp. TaxID=1180 RepID=UPI002FF59FC7
NLAFLYKSQGRYSDAESLLIEALAMRKHLLGANHPNTINTRENLEALRQNRQPLFRRMVAFVSRWFQ